MGGEVIVITSGKGGVGKTTITANIGSSLADIGKKVVLVNGDRIDHDMVESGNMLAIEDSTDILNIKPIGTLMDNRAITISTHKGEPIVLDETSEIGNSFKEIAMRIIDCEILFENNIEVDISDIRISFAKSEYNDKNYSELIANILLRK